MQTLRRGLLAGLLAGLVLAMLNFVTDGTPGRLLPEALHWFGITIANLTISKFAGFFLLLVLGGCLVSSLACSRGRGSSRSVARSSQGLRSALSGGSSSHCCLRTL